MGLVTRLSAAIRMAAFCFGSLPFGFSGPVQRLQSLWLKKLLTILGYVYSTAGLLFQTVLLHFVMQAFFRGQEYASLSEAIVGYTLGFTFIASFILRRAFFLLRANPVVELERRLAKLASEDNTGGDRRRYGGLSLSEAGYLAQILISVAGEVAFGLKNIFRHPLFSARALVILLVNFDSLAARFLLLRLLFLGSQQLTQHHR